MKRDTRPLTVLRVGATVSIGALACAFGIAVAAQLGGCVDGATADCSDANTYCGPDAAVDSGLVVDAGDAGDARNDGSIDASDAADTATPIDSGDASDDASNADADAG